MPHIFVLGGRKIQICDENCNAAVYKDLAFKG